MSYVKINNKQYIVPEFGFRESKKLEQCGVSLLHIADANAMLTIVSAFVAVIVNVTPEAADELIEQHILGGGSLESLFEAYTNAITDSGFFKKLLENQEKQEKQDTAKTTKTTKAID